jgi:hypothetical protein
LLGQRVFGIALGYEDLNDHDLRHDPMMAVLAGKLAARREDCAPLAGKSTLNRLELSRLQSTRYHKISHNPIAIKRLMVDLFLEAHERAPSEIILDRDPRSRFIGEELGSESIYLAHHWRSWTMAATPCRGRSAPSDRGTPRGDADRGAATSPPSSTAYAGAVEPIAPGPAHRRRLRPPILAGRRWLQPIRKPIEPPQAF